MEDVCIYIRNRRGKPVNIKKKIKLQDRCIFQVAGIVINNRTVTMKNGKLEFTIFDKKISPPDGKVFDIELYHA